MSRTILILIIVLLIIIVINPTFADWKENAEVMDISGGEDHTLILTKDKTAWACGPNGHPGLYYGGLGTGSNDANLIEKTLVRVWDGDMDTPSDYLENIDDVDAGWKHSLALDVNGLVWSWGDNREGQLGDNQNEWPESTTPIKVHDGEMNTISGYLEYIIAISAGRSGEHSLAVDANNFAYAWGYDEYGQCGNGDAVERELTPVRILRGQQPDDPYNPDTNLTRIVAVSAGQTHSMALEKDDPNDPNCDGRVYTFGSNTWPIEYGDYPAGYGKLGIGTDDPCRSTPVAVLSGQQHPNDPNLKHIVAVSAGWDHSMALEKLEPNDPNHKGRVYTWGSNGPGWGDGLDPCSVGGRLGDGTTTSRSTPVIVLRGEQPPEDPNNPDLNLTRIVAISAGEGHSMALDEDGYVYAWGDNYFGQLVLQRNIGSRI